MEKIDYKHLYNLQDRILKLIFERNNSFYLTGGTALHRFYYRLRHSDDLDFFSSRTITFGEDIREIINSFDINGISYNRTIQARDFQRIIIDKVLQLDFANDRLYRYGKSNIRKPKIINMPII